MPVDVITAVRDLIEKILGDHATAAQFAADPQGMLAAQGITDGNLSNVDVQQLAGQVCGGMDLPSSTQTAVQNYAGGGYSGSYRPAPSNSGSPAVDHVVQQLQQLTYVTYSDDHSITEVLTDNSTNIDNSTTVDADGSHGDITVDTDNSNATGSGVATSGDGNTVTAATGDHSAAASSVFGDAQANTGAGAVQNTGDIFGDVNTGAGAVQGNEISDSSVNTGTFTGIQASDSTIDHTVVGDHNTVNQVQGDAVIGDHNQTVQNHGDLSDSALGFGSGDVSNASDNSVGHGAVAAGGDATNVSDNQVGPGGAVSGTGDAYGYSSTETHTDNHIDQTSTTVQGMGNQVETTADSSDTHQHEEQQHSTPDYPHDYQPDYHQPEYHAEPLEDHGPADLPAHS